MVTACVFLFAAWVYWRRNFAFSAHSFAKVENTESRSDARFSTRRANIPFFEVNQPAVVIANCQLSRSGRSPLSEQQTYSSGSSN
jgi:hypothetical protein